MTQPSQVAIPFTSDIPYDADRVGAAAVCCSDGRYGDQIDEFLHHALGLPRYDRVTLPGGAACLCHITALREAGALDRQLRFLIEAHDLHTVILVAHHDCGFYRHVRLKAGSLEAQQMADLKAAADRIRNFGTDVRVQAFFARKVEGKVRFESVDGV